MRTKHAVLIGGFIAFLYLMSCSQGDTSSGDALRFVLDPIFHLIEKEPLWSIPGIAAIGVLVYNWIRHNFCGEHDNGCLITIGVIILLIVFALGKFYQSIDDAIRESFNKPIQLKHPVQTPQQ